MSQSYHLVHTSFGELEEFDKLQQFSQRWDFSPYVRVYTEGLEKAFENPQFLKAFLNYARKKYAKGGRVSIEKMTPQEIEEARHAGRFGDTCLAVIGPNMRAAMDRLSPTKGSINPQTGFPEYFFLNDMIHGIGNAFSGITGGLGNLLGGMGGSGGLMGGLKNIGGSLLGGLGQALPGVLGSLGNLAGGALGARFGGPAGAAMGSQLAGGLGSALGGLGGQIFNQFGQKMSPEGAQSPMANAWGTNMQNFASNMAGGMPMQQAFGNAMTNMGHQAFGQSPLGQGIQNFGQNLAGGQGMMPALQQAYQQTGGMGPMGQAAMNAFNSYRQGANPLQAMGNAANYMTQSPQYGPQPNPEWQEGQS